MTNRTNRLLGLAAAVAACGGLLVSVPALAAGVKVRQEPERAVDRVDGAAGLRKTVDKADQVTGKFWQLQLAAVPSESDLAAAIEPLAFQPATLYYNAWAGSSFRPNEGGAGYNRLGNGCVYTTTGAQLSHDVDLPYGAEPYGFRIIYDRVGSDTSSLCLTRYTIENPASSDVSCISATGTTGLGFDTDSTLSGITIDGLYNYQLIWVNTANSANKFCGARVYYHMPPQGTYNPITPCRAWDTRSSGPALGASARNFQISGSCGVPTDATGITANVTATDTSVSSWLAVYPQGTTWPGVSTLNWGAGQTLANGISVKLGPGGAITAFVGGGGTTNFIVDVTGYYY